MSAPRSAGEASAGRDPRPAAVHTVTLFGSGNCTDEEMALAEEVGMGIGSRGWVLRNGGYGGTMAAAARGAREVGGRVVGITCSAFERSGPNSYLSEALETRDLFGRLAGLIDGADAFGAFVGGTGTLTEVFLTWELMAKRLISPRPLCVIGPGWESWWELWAGDRTLSRRLGLLSRARDARDALEKLAPGDMDGSSEARSAAAASADSRSWNESGMDTGSGMTARPK